VAEARLSSKTAIVTGAGNGIGRAIAEAFASEGAAVLCADIAEDDARVVADGIVAAGGQAAPWLCDVSVPADAEATVQAAMDAFGALHVLVNNAAGFVPLTPVEDTPVENWDKTLAVILSGAFHMSKPAIPCIRDSGGGNIIHVASQMGRVAWPGQAAYCAAKGALLQLAKVMALECADDGIRVNTLSPGGIATDRLRHRFGDLENAEREWGPKHPLGRLGTPEEMGRAAVFLASDDASFMTGADLLVDGGYTAW
jgi:NAD(P)-dependent dehydrogenase (short-subunit alcohol dehydrogenase family)